jgi:hypothetical protein
MAVAEYTQEELQSLVTEQINKIPEVIVKFVIETEGEEAYNSSVRECGFEIPVTSDADKAQKYHWLIERMRRWFYGRLLEQRFLRFDAGELLASKVAERLAAILKAMDDQFKEAKGAAETAALFVDADTQFGSDIVIGPGLIDDRIGQPMEERA